MNTSLASKNSLKIPVDYKTAGYSRIFNFFLQIYGQMNNGQMPPLDKR